MVRENRGGSLKRTLVGLANNIHLNKSKIKLWVESFRKHSGADVCLLGANMSDDDKKTCAELSLPFEAVQVDNSYYINHKRLEHISKWIKKNDYELILSTDVFDVAFQNDPFEKLNTNEFDMFFGGEGIRVENEQWNYLNIEKLFKEELEKCKKNEVVCSGVIAGKKNAIIQVYDRMFQLCEASPDNDNIKDQAALNVMIANSEIPKMKLFNLDEGWAVHCAVAGPTQFFEGWGFKDNLLYGIPQIKDGVVTTSAGKTFDIVHQFNRIPEWHASIEGKIYGSM